jgi:hypothetical protein
MNTTASRQTGRLRLGLLIFFACLSQTGCSLLPEPKADPTRYYVLTGPVSADPAHPGQGALVLGLRSVQIAPYLNGKAMIVRNAPNEIAYQDFARWAEPLDVGVGRLMAERLAVSEKVKRVYPQPFPFDVERDYDLRIEVLRCEGARKTDGTTVASFACMVEVTQAKPGGSVVLRKVFSAPETPWNGQDFSALARQLSGALDTLIADVISALPARDLR